MKKIFTISLLLLTLLSCRESSEISDSPLEFWETSTFEDEELIKDPINTLLSSVEEGKYGYVDHILLIKNGKIVLDQTFDNDYEQISQGRIGPLGCGFKTCEDSNMKKS